jgi:hypothetical protein
MELTHALEMSPPPTSPHQYQIASYAPRQNGSLPKFTITVDFI